MFLFGTQYVMFMIVNSLSIERFIAVRYPFFASKHKLSSLSRVIKVIVVIWLVTYSVTIPGCLGIGVKPVVIGNWSTMVCEVDSKVSVVSLYMIPLFFFCLTLSVICVVYTLIAVTLRKSVSSNNERSFYKKERALKILREYNFMKV